MAKGTADNVKTGDMLYFIRAGEFVKIGRTNDLDKRIASLQCGCPLPIDEATGFPGFAGLERQMHSLFAAHRTQGEWFRWNDEIGRMVAKLARRAALADRKRRRNGAAYYKTAALPTELIRQRRIS